MSHRHAILARIRSGLGHKGADASRSIAIEKRLSAPQRHLIPARTLAKPPQALIRLLRGFLESQTATVIDVSSRDDVPAAIAGYLRANNLPARVRAGRDPLLAALPWSREPALEIGQGHADPADQVGLSRAVAGVAETGTLILASGPDNPVTLSFLPETHVVLLPAKDIVGPYEDAWIKLRERFDGALPRTVNMISGPSCTGDIGASIIRGAHGPRRLCVIILAE
jgi:L-lactate dehydrogenase complex protein LldG